MRALRAVLATLLLFLLLPVLLAQVVLSSGRITLGSPEFVRARLEEGGWAQALPRAVADQIHTALANTDEPVPFSREELVAMAERALPPQQVWALTDAVLTGAYGWLTGRTPVPQIVLDLASLKQELPGAIRTALLARIQQLPPCSPQQLAAMATAPPQGLPPCRPANGALLADMVQRWPLEQALAGIPDHLDVAAAIAAGDSRAWQRLQRVPVSFRMVRLLGLWGWGVVGVGLGLLALVAYRNRYAALGWCGAALFLIGVPLVTATFLVGPALFTDNPWLPWDRVPALLQPSVTALGTGIVDALRLHGAVLGGFGLVLWSWALIGGARARNQRPPAGPPGEPAIG